MELKCSEEGRGLLDTAFKEVMGASGIVHLLTSKIEVEIAAIEPIIEAEDVEDAVRGFFEHGSKSELKVSLSKRPLQLEGICASGGGARFEIILGDPHKNRVGLLPSPPKDGGKSVLPLSWFWPHGGELKKAVNQNTETRRRAPIEHDPGV